MCICIYFMYIYMCIKFIYEICKYIKYIKYIVHMKHIFIYKDIYIYIQ